MHQKISQFKALDIWVFKQNKNSMFHTQPYKRSEIEKIGFVSEKIEIATTEFGIGVCASY